MSKKKAYKDYNIPSMCITKDNLLKTKTIKLVQCATQCTPMRNGAICSFVWVITPYQMPWKMESPSHPKADPLGSHVRICKALVFAHHIQNHTLNVVWSCTHLNLFKLHHPPQQLFQPMGNDKPTYLETHEYFHMILVVSFQKVQQTQKVPFHFSCFHDCYLNHGL